MGKFTSVVFGAVCVLLGLGAWIAYNLLVERLPETQGRSPVVPILFATALVATGVSRLRKALRDDPGHAQRVRR